jgi:predicted DNA-binding antitoxin AbrB/MazE fold protein
MTTVEAVYEHGVLRLLEPLPFADGTPVEVMVVERATTGGAQAAAMLTKIAELPLENEQEAFSNREHDAILYGGKNRA